MATKGLKKFAEGRGEAGADLKKVNEGAILLVRTVGYSFLANLANRHRV